MVPIILLGTDFLTGGDGTVHVLMSIYTALHEACKLVRDWGFILQQMEKYCT